MQKVFHYSHSLDLVLTFICTCNIFASSIFNRPLPHSSSLFLFQTFCRRNFFVFVFLKFLFGGFSFDAILMKIAKILVKHSMLLTFLVFFLSFFIFIFKIYLMKKFKTVGDCARTTSSCTHGVSMTYVSLSDIQSAYM